MWANAQRDGRRAEHSGALCSFRKVWLTPTARVPCSNAAKKQNLLKFAGVLQTPEPISAAGGQSSPYDEDMWRTYCCLTSFCPIVDMCLTCEDIAGQSCAMVPRWRLFMAALRSRCGHYIFILWFLLSFFFFYFLA